MKSYHNMKFNIAQELKQQLENLHCHYQTHHLLQNKRTKTINISSHAVYSHMKHMVMVDTYTSSKHAVYYTHFYHKASSSR